MSDFFEDEVYPSFLDELESYEIQDVIHIISKLLQSNDTQVNSFLLHKPLRLS